MVLILISGFYSAFAQDENEPAVETKGKFKKENLFTGGGATLSIGGYSTVLGASPVFGYSINKWLDAGIVFNFTYASSRDVYYDPYTGRYLVSDDKARQTVFGPGVFARFYPLKFLFINVQANKILLPIKQFMPTGQL